MKITCQSCQAKYTIADEKVVGKTVKIKCKKCGATIVVNGNEQAAGGAGPAPAYEQPPAQSPLGSDDEEGATKVFTEGAPGPGGDEWTVNITDEDQRTFTTAQLVIEYQRGVITADTYVWKDGMTDWLPLSGVPELVVAAGSGAPAPARAPAPAPAAGALYGGAMAAPAPVAAAAPMAAAAVDPEHALGGTMIMQEGAPSPFAAQPVAAAQPAAAARRSNRGGGGVDLFQQKADGQPAAAPTATTSADRLVGERNENSVLFSISALTAAAAATKKGNDAILDLGGPAPARNGGRAGLDDIMNLGGGMGAAPVLAPPPLLAPVVEAPPPPQPVAVAAAPVAYPGMAMQAPPKKSSAGIIIGVVGALIGVGGIAAFVLMRPAAAPASGGAESATAVAANNPPPATATAATAAAPTTTATTAPPAADTAASPAGTGTGAANAAPAGGSTDKGKPVAAGAGDSKHAKVDDKKADDKKADKKADDKKAEEKKPDEKKADDKGGGGGKEFDRAAAMSALSAAAGGARGCKQPDGPTGSGKVRVTFAPSGNVTSASVEGPPFAGTAVGGCVAASFRGAHVPAFDGSPVSVSKSFSIN